MSTSKQYYVKGCAMTKMMTMDYKSKEKEVKNKHMCHEK
jgi:hypothetical protein